MDECLDTMKQSEQERLEKKLLDETRKKARLKIVEKGIEEFGWDFFLVDPRQVTIRAVLFRIQNEVDKELFVEEASYLIPWEPKPNNSVPKEEMFRRLISKLI